MTSHAQTKAGGGIFFILILALIGVVFFLDEDMQDKRITGTWTLSNTGGPLTNDMYDVILNTDNQDTSYTFAVVRNASMRALSFTSASRSVRVFVDPSAEQAHAYFLDVAGACTDHFMMPTTMIADFRQAADGVVGGSANTEIIFNTLKIKVDSTDDAGPELDPLMAHPTGCARRLEQCQIVANAEQCSDLPTQFQEYCTTCCSDGNCYKAQDAQEWQICTSSGRALERLTAPSPTSRRHLLQGGAGSICTDSCS